MAALGPAVSRIRYLIGKVAYQASPSTINGGPNEIRSYNMVIATKRGDDTWDVVDPKTSPSVTTSRHIRAAHAALVEGRP